MTTMGSRQAAGAAPAPKPDLKVVRRRRSKRLIKRAGGRRLAPFTITAAIAIAAIVGAVLLEQVVLAQSAFELTKIRRQLTAAEENREVLMLEAAKLDSEARIESYARDHLGMVDPAPETVRYIVAEIPGGSRSGVLAKAIDRHGHAGRAATTAAATGVTTTP